MLLFVRLESCDKFMNVTITFGKHLFANAMYFINDGISPHD